MARLIGYAVGHISTGLPRWMYVFLIFGSFSLVTGIFALWLLPDLPSKAKFLTERERAIAVDRVAINRQGVKNQQFKWYQVWQAARDPKTWLLFVMAIGAQVPNSALTSVSYGLNLAKFPFFRGICEVKIMLIVISDIEISSLLLSSVPSASILWEHSTYRFQVARSNS